MHRRMSGKNSASPPVVGMAQGIGGSKRDAVQEGVADESGFLFVSTSETFRAGWLCRPNRAASVAPLHDAQPMEQMDDCSRVTRAAQRKLSPVVSPAPSIQQPSMIARTQSKQAILDR